MTATKTILLNLLKELLVSCSDLSNTDYSENSSQDKAENDENSDGKGFMFEDGTHSATVDYHIPETAYSQTYNLDVEVENCEVVQINFSKGGWLDNHHISPSELDADGSCLIDGEGGKTYQIQIAN